MKHRDTDPESCRESLSPAKGVFPAEEATLAAFDFDGTLTYCDTFLPFIRHAVGRRRFFAGMLRLAPQAASFALGRLGGSRFKEIVLTHFLGGWTAGEMDRAAKDFAQGPLARMTNPQALMALDAHRAKSHETIIVSASPELYLRPWADLVGAGSVLGTRLNMQGDIFTGRLQGANCKGAEKVARLEAHVPGFRRRPLVAYGDSKGDREMLAAAHQGHFRPFRTPLFRLRSGLVLLRALALSAGDT